MLAAELNVVPPATLPVRTLADVRDTLTRMSDPPTGTSLMVSAINTIARTLGCAPDDLRRRSGGTAPRHGEGFARNGRPDKWQLGVNQESSSQGVADSQGSSNVRPAA